MSISKVVFLKAKPTRYFRCLEIGHVSSKCYSPHDRSGLCFRCSLLGHRAYECVNDYFCILCAERGSSSDHSIRSSRCTSEAPLGKNERNQVSYVESGINASQSFPDRSIVGIDVRYKQCK